MKCPFCGYTESKVIDSRPTDEGSRIRRRRECLECGKKFTTYEIIESLPIIVVKRDKSREVFDRNKLFNGMLRACEKRPVSIETLEKAVDDIELQIQNSLEREVTATQIGEYAMNKLKEIDEVAYVRFASVYRQFKDINSFHEAITSSWETNDSGSSRNQQGDGMEPVPYRLLCFAPAAALSLPPLQRLSFRRFMLSWNGCAEIFVKMKIGGIFWGLSRLYWK